MFPFSKKTPKKKEPRGSIDDISKEDPIDASRTAKELWDDYVKYGDMFIDVVAQTKPPSEDIFLTAVKKRIYNRLLGKKKRK